MRTEEINQYCTTISTYISGAPIYDLENAISIIDRIRMDPSFKLESMMLWSFMDRVACADVSPNIFKKEMLSLSVRNKVDTIIIGGKHKDARATFTFDIVNKEIGITMVYKYAPMLNIVQNFVESFFANEF